MNKKPICAILYDFDSTLATTDMQNFGFIPAMGMSKEEFWGRTGKFSSETGCERILSYLYTMVEVAKEKLGSMPWVSFRVGDFLESDFHEEFDVIVLYNAYPHFLEPEKLAKRFYASLKKGGKFAIVHSLGRKELDSHHAAIASKVSRSLDPVEEEAKRFDSFFHIEEAVEGEHFFFLAGSKI